MGQIILIWLITTLVGLLTFPLLYSILPDLRDRGYSVSRIVGLLLTAYLAWLISSFKLLPFGTPLVGLAVGAVAAVSIAIAWKKREEFFSYCRENLRLLLGIELLFILLFAVFLLIVSLNPAIDPDSERFMDYALLNSIDRTQYFPPIDPWFSGHTMNYYYWGYIIVAALHKLAIIIPLPIFFNLALALVYSLFCLACFGIGYNLTGKIAYGLLGILLLMFIGNLDGFKQIMAGKFSSFNFFHGARVLVQRGPGGEIIDYPINEFPFFSLMWGDLHPYVIAFSLNLTVLNLLLSLIRKTRSLGAALKERLPETITLLLVLSIALGALFGTNTWDYPIYIAVAALVIFFQGRENLKEGWEDPLRWVVFALALFSLSFLLYLPFNLPFLTAQAAHGRGGIGVVPVRSPLGLFLTAFGITLFFLGADLISRLSRTGKKSERLSQKGLPLLFALVAVIMIFVGGVKTLFPPTYLFLLILGVLILLPLFLSPLEKDERFALILALSAAGLALICEFWYLKDHYDPGGYRRMNTVFKLYIHVWLFLGTAAVYFIYHLNRRLAEKKGPRRLWKTATAVFCLAGLFYPLGAIGVRIRSRPRPLTLNGFDYISHPVPAYQKKEWRWDPNDLKAAEWMEKNIPGRPTILESAGNAYDWASRISTFTGMPTLTGWVNHEAGWRNDWKEPGERQRDTSTIYETTDLNSAWYLINKYGIAYIYVGALERERYPEEALKKFQQMGKAVYREGPVVIWKVK